MSALVDVEAQLAGLKDFQRRTARYVFERLYDRDDPAHRFLVADEVGLGKTLVARGVIAQTVDHLQRIGTERIDVVYVCSNAAIARQNLKRLNVTEHEVSDVVDRLTLLPVSADNLDSRRFNLVPITPGTSLKFGHRTGRWEERALLHWLVTDHYGTRRKGIERAFAGRLGDRGAAMFADFRARNRANLDTGTVEVFCTELDRRDRSGRDAGVRDRLDRLADGYRRRKDRYPGWLDEERKALVGELRTLLAECSVALLRPDLVILDEFQRFKDLLADNEGASHAARLTRRLFDFSDPGTAERTRVLLLSATPYKMYTLGRDREPEDHYRDLVLTLEFLLGDGAAVGELERDLTEMREGLVDAALDGGRRATDACGRIERQLRRVMVRNERLASTPDRSGMLEATVTDSLEVTSEDIGRYVDTSRISAHLGHRHVTEFWKSASYLLSFMEGYQLKRLFEERVLAGDAELAALVDRARSLLPWEQVERYERVDPGNARLRYLLDDTVGRGVWRLLWLPPALPYYRSGTAYDDEACRRFTKRLVFSSWTVVPKVVASLTSYEAERRMVEAGGRERSYTRTSRPTRLLEFNVEAGQPRAMTLFTLLHPSFALADTVDPNEIAGRLAEGGGDGLGDALPTSGEARADAAATVRGLLERLLADNPPARDTEDPRWYWAAPLLLDRQRQPGSVRALYQGTRLSMVWTGEEQGEARQFRRHLDEVARLLDGQLDLGRPPADLAEVVADVALAAPATAALRSLGRQGLDTRDRGVRQVAARIGWGFRSLFNHPEVTGMVQAEDPNRPYWRAVLGHALGGHLQAVLDEYVHVLRDWLGMGGEPLDADKAGELGEAAVRALSLRTASYAVDVPTVGEAGVDIDRKHLRGRFAVPFGDLRGADEQQLARSGQVLEAYNSPFWPFVLASTSLGQEGLDFHLYSHAVVHWNLPSNPVDLEQREGRVHRYKGHAVRKNVAARCGQAATRGAGTGEAPGVAGGDPWEARGAGGDPWAAMFEAAASQRADGDTEIVPYWVFDPGGDGAHVERHVPMLPMTREIGRYRALERSLAAYRLAFGAPRQSELVRFLQDRHSDEEIVALATRLRIDLSPPRQP